MRSFPSDPRIASKTTAQSSIEFAIGPTLSIDHERAIAPCLLTLPKVGRNPVTPHLVEGDMIEPQVSVPMAKGTILALTAAADPALEPLEPNSLFHGDFV